MIANSYDSLISVFATDRRSPNGAPSSTNDLYTLHQKCFKGKDINLIIKNPQIFFSDLISLIQSYEKLLLIFVLLSISSKSELSQIFIGQSFHEYNLVK